MELEQLVSFVRYQKGQKQGWDALDEVLTIVQEATERVKLAEKEVAYHTSQVDDMKASLAAMDNTIDAKLMELQVSLASKEEDFASASRKRQADLDKSIESKGYQIEQLDLSILRQSELAEKLSLEINDLQADKSTLEAELAKIRNVLADIKAKL